MLTISDGRAQEHAATLSAAASICEDWYDYMVDGGLIPDACHPNLDWSTLESLQESIRSWEGRIAAACGMKDWYGHGRYAVSARDRVGLRLTVDEQEPT